MLTDECDNYLRPSALARMSPVVLARPASGHRTSAYDNFFSYDHSELMIACKQSFYPWKLSQA